MKKLRNFLFIFMSLLIITGCGSSKKESTSATDELQEALLKFKDTKAISLTVQMNMNVEGMQLPMNIDFQIKDDAGYMKYSMNLLGMEYYQEMYMLKKEGEAYIYSHDSETGTWSYTKGESVFEFSLTDVKNEEISYEEMMNEYFKSMIDAKEVKTDKEGYKKFEVTISRENLKEMVKDKLTTEEFSNFDMTDIDSFPEKVEFYIYLKNGEVSIIYFDLSNLNMGDSATEALSKFDITLEIKGIDDKVEKITLPKEAENATYVDPKDMDFFGSNDDDLGNDDFLEDM